jgi:hypothetical protein
LLIVGVEPTRIIIMATVYFWFIITWRKPIYLSILSKEVKQYIILRTKSSISIMGVYPLPARSAHDNIHLPRTTGKFIPRIISPYNKPRVESYSNMVYYSRSPVVIPTTWSLCTLYIPRLSRCFIFYRSQLYRDVYTSSQFI